MTWDVAGLGLAVLTGASLMLRYILARGVRQDKRVDRMEERYVRLVENHLQHSTAAMNNVADAVRELKGELRK